MGSTEPSPDVPLPSTAAVFPKPLLSSLGLQLLRLLPPAATKQSWSSSVPCSWPLLQGEETGQQLQTSRCETSWQPWDVSVAPGLLVLVVLSSPASPAWVQLLRGPIREWAMPAVAHVMPKMFLGEGVFSVLRDLQGYSATA